MKKIICIILIYVCTLASGFAQDGEIIDVEVIDPRRHTFTSFGQAARNPLEVYKLRLSGHYLNIYPQELSIFKNLVSLSLNGNEIPFILPEIGDLVNLEILALYDNPNLSTLPAEISKLKKLKQLYLSGCNFSVLPKEIEDLENLELLDVRNNQNLTILSVNFQKLKKLKYLDVKNPKMSLEEKVKIKKMLPNCRIVE